jgi:hypothetical protein
MDLPSSGSPHPHQQHSQSPLPNDISQGLQSLHLYNQSIPPQSIPFSLQNNSTTLAMIQEHQVLKSSLPSSPGLPYPEISVTDENGCLPIYILHDDDANRRPSITRGILGKVPPVTEPLHHGHGTSTPPPLHNPL